MLIEFNNLKKEKIKAGISTRIGGVSKKPYNSMNLGIYTDDLKEDVEENYDIFLNALDIDKNKTFYTLQIHGDKIKIIDREFYNNSDSFTAIENYDGMISTINGINLVTFYADCVPLLFYDKKQNIIGVCHSGWRGTVKKIAKKMINTFQSEFNSNLEDIICAIGPSADVCCYEVDKSVINEFDKHFAYAKECYIAKENGKYMLDLKKVNYKLLIELGIKKINIEISNLCTICNNDILYSHRKESGITGRHIGIISK